MLSSFPSRLVAERKQLMPVLLGLCLARGKLAVPGPHAHKSIGSNSYEMMERAVLFLAGGGSLA